jgi:enamine deaminase RidA (YjgF/YER057c/UK114 family)
MPECTNLHVFITRSLKHHKKGHAGHHMTERRGASSGSPFEATFGFRRAVRVGDRIVVSGTAPIWADGSCPEDAGSQAERCFEIIAGALADLGASLGDVVRTRMYVTSAAHAEAIGEVHGRLFESNQPAATMVVVAGLLDPRWKVEIEAEAVLRADPGT